MQNPATSRPSKQLHEISESAREAFDQAIPELRGKVRGIATETTEQLSEATHKARGWVEQNYGKTLGIIGAIAAIGTLGYFIGRNSTMTDIDLLHDNPIEKT